MKFDYCLILIFVCVQWRISVLCLHAGSARLSQHRLALLRAGVLAFDGLIAFGYFCTFYERASRLGIPGWLGAPLGGAAMAYLLAATAVLAVYEVLRRLSRKLGADTDPSRRRIIQAGGSALMAAPFAALGYGVFIERLDFRVPEVDVPLAGLAGGSGWATDPAVERHPFERVPQRNGPGPGGGCSARVAASPDGGHRRSDFFPRRSAGRLHPAAGAAQGGRRRVRLHGQPRTVRARGGLHRGCGGPRGHRVSAPAVAPVALSAARSSTWPAWTISAWATARHTCEGAERAGGAGRGNVLLSHNPDVFPVAAHQGYHLVIAGHTHGGQVTVEILDQSISAGALFHALRLWAVPAARARRHM